MLSALMVFLVGALVLAVVIYVVNLVLGMLTLPDPVRQIALLIVSLILLLALVILAANVYGGGYSVTTILR